MKRGLVQAVVVASLAVYGCEGGLGGNGEAGSTEGSSTSTKTGSSSLSEWVRSLPEGEEPDLPYIKDGTVFFGETELSLRGYPYRVLGAAPHGLLVEDINDANEFRFGVAHDDGNVHWLTSPAFDALGGTATDGQHFVATAGPDQTVLRLYDLDHEELVAHVGTGGYVEPVAITSRGVVYKSGDIYHGGSALLWTPGQPPVEVGFHPFAASDDLTVALAIKPSTPCASAVRVQKDLTTKVVYQGCGPERPLSLAPDGRHAITPNLSLVDLDLAVGTSASLTDVPVRVWIPDIVWEDPEHALIRLQTTHAVALVRCSIDGGCQTVFTDVPKSPNRRDIQVLDPSIQPYG